MQREYHMLFLQIHNTTYLASVGGRSFCPFVVKGYVYIYIEREREHLFIVD